MLAFSQVNFLGALFLICYIRFHKNSEEILKVKTVRYSVVFTNFCYLHRLKTDGLLNGTEENPDGTT